MRGEMARSMSMKLGDVMTQLAAATSAQQELLNRQHDLDVRRWQALAASAGVDADLIRELAPRRMQVEQTQYEIGVELTRSSSIGAELRVLAPVARWNRAQQRQLSQRLHLTVRIQASPETP